MCKIEAPPILSSAHRFQRKSDSLGSEMNFTINIEEQQQQSKQTKKSLRALIQAQYHKPSRVERVMARDGVCTQTSTDDFEASIDYPFKEENSRMI